MRNSLLLAAFVATTVTGTGTLLAQVQPNRPVATSPQGTNVAVIDIGLIFKNATRFKMAMEDLKAGDERFQQEITRRSDALKARIQELEKMKRGSPNYQVLEEQIAGDKTRLQLDVARKQKERIELEAKVYYNAYEEIEAQVRVFAGRHGIDLVLRFNSQKMDLTKPESVLSGINRFVVFQNRLNITDQILNEMNVRTPNSRPRVSDGQFLPPGSGTRRQ